MLIKTGSREARISNNAKKGRCGYYRHLKKVTTIKTIVFFAVSFLLFIAGYVQTGTRNNVLTVVAILGCLPASKSAVNMIMALRAKGCSEEDAALFQPYENDIFLLYDLYITSETKSYDVSCMAVTENFIYAYVQDKRADTKAAEAHVQSILSLNQKPAVPVRFLTDRDTFLQRLADIRQAEKAKTKEQPAKHAAQDIKAEDTDRSAAHIEEIADIIKAISL